MTALTDRIAQACGDPGSIVKRGDNEPASRWATRAVIQVLTDALAVMPCHVTGMHDPSHTPRYQCGIQVQEALARLLVGLEIDPAGLPRRLHGPDCYWCHDVPNQERYRAQRREVYEWAGVPVPPEMAAPADDDES